jgi:septum formation inhibitor-activating ATPase MinD
MAFVKQVVEDEEVGARFLDLHFDVGRPVAYALVEALDDFIKIKAVCRILGAKYIKKLITVPQAADAVGLEQRIRGRLPQY